jgi:hypothetical protein
VVCLSFICSVRPWAVGVGRHRHIDWEDAPGFAAARGSRLLTASYEPGDVVLFSQFMLHGSFDGNSATGAARMSVDLRWHAKHNGGYDERYVLYPCAVVQCTCTSLTRILIDLYSRRCVLPCW